MSRELNIEAIDDVLDCMDEPAELEANIFPIVKRNVFSRYLECDICCDTEMIRGKTSGTNDLDSDEVIVSIEKIAM